MTWFKFEDTNTKYKHIKAHRKIYTIFLDIKTFNEKDFANHVFCFVASHHLFFVALTLQPRTQALYSAWTRPAQVMLGCAKYIHQYFGINFH